MSYKHETRLHVQSELARRGWSKAAQVIIEFFDALENSDEYKATQARIADLEAALIEATESIEGWAGYAAEYFREKHGLAEEVARLKALAEGGKHG